MAPTPPSSSLADPSRTDAFALETESVLTDLRDSLAAILARLDPAITRASELRMRLGLDSKLSWSIFNAASAEDPRTLSPLLPGWRAMNRFFIAAGENGVPEDTIVQARDEFQRFERTIRRHASDRGTFDAMVSALSPEKDDLVDERLRKRLFTDHSILWGVRSKCSFLCYICRPEVGGKGGDREDAGIITGCFQLEQLREGQPLSLETSAIADTASSAGKLLSQFTESMPEGERSPLVLLREFCSGPAPEVHKDQGGIAGERTVFQFGGLGRASAIDLVMVQTIKRMPLRADAPYSAFAVPTSPSEVSYCDFLLPVGVSDPQSVRARVFGNRLNMSRAFDRRPEDILPMRVTAMYRGRARFSRDSRPDLKFPLRSPLAMPESKNYAQVVDHVVRDLGWTDFEYDVYRCHVQYPVLHALVEVVVDRVRR